jgi:hypothetical protein
MAEEMGHSDSTRLSQLGSGRLSADASEIVYLAEAAELPPIETLASIESKRHPELAQVWEKVILNTKQKQKRRPKAALCLGGNGGIRTLDEALHPILP